MFPRSLRFALVVVCLLSVIVFGLSFKSSSAAGDKSSSRRGRLAQTSQTLGQNSRKEGPPNYDAFGADRKRAATDNARAAQVEPQFQAGHAVQVEPRLGVPTFIWATAPAQSKGEQIFADQGRTATDIETAARSYIGDYSSDYRLSATDVAAARLVAVHDTGKGAIIAKFKQEIGGIEVFRDEVNVVMNRDLQLVALTGYLTGDDFSTAPQDFSLQPADALSKALEDLTGTALNPAAVRGMTRPSAQAGAKEKSDYSYFTASIGAGTQMSEPARVKQVMYHAVNGFIPAYYVEVEVLVTSADETSVTLDGPGVKTESLYYAYVISAVDGQLLFRKNLTENDGTPYSYRVWADPVTLLPYDTPEGNDIHPKIEPTPDGVQPPFLAPNLVTLANFPFSKNDPWLPAGSTATLGNNVDAYVDLVTGDGYGPVATAPYGGAPACANPAVGSATCGDFRAGITSPNTFDRVFDTALAPSSSGNQRQAATQQLFYDVNFLHDWFYDAGFDEAAGNAQTDNYGRGGLGNDSIKAEAQDFGGTDNANMSTPSDGGRPRMQMYVFNPNNLKVIDILSPPAIAGSRATGIASAAGPQTFDLTADVVRGVFNSGQCTYSNAASMSGKIVMVDYGTGSCFGPDMSNAVAAGASGFILVWQSSNPDQVVNFTGSFAALTIPWGSLSWNNGLLVKGQLAASNTVSVRMRRTSGAISRDGTIDNQIVAHEWGHYISNRLIADSVGLGNNQGRSMGEGWGDFTAMLLTVRADDAGVASNANWAGVYTLSTYATGGAGNAWSPDGNGAYFGIRRYPYSTDMTKNPLTFGHIANGVTLPVGPPISFGASGSNNAEVHNSGEVWTTMLWECYASLLRDTQGAAPRLTFSEAQTRMKNYLVAAYKMTPVNPTFLEARDALLVAAYTYDSEDGRLFVQAFAKRGAGVAAVAPDRFSLNHSAVTESFSTGAGLAYVGASLDDSVDGCDGDGYLDNTEKGLLTVTLKNTGDADLFNIKATASSANAHVTFPQGATINFAPARPGESVTGSVVVSVSGAVGIETTDFTVTFEDTGAPVAPAAAHFFARVSVAEIPASTATDTVESRLTTWNIAGGSPTGPDVQWTRVGTPGSGTNHQWYAPDANQTSDQRLTSPVFTVDGSGSVNFQFDHSFSFEFDSTANYDGGVIEMSVNGGAFTDIGAGSYNGTITNGAGFTNPIRGRSGFVKSSNGTQHVSVTKAVAPGSTVQFRFRSGSDGGGSAAGWYVDNIAFTGVVETPFTTLVGDTNTCHPPAPTPGVTILFSPELLPTAKVGEPYTATVTASGSNGPYIYSVAPVILPQGLSSGVGGGGVQITGTPAYAGVSLVTVTANDSNGHQGSKTYSLTINKGDPVITWSDPGDITYGTPLGAAQLNATSSVPGTFTYTPQATTVLNAGANQSLSVNFVPTDTANYNNASKTVHINVLKATPVITWANPADINYGTALGATQLNATASVAGAFTYTPPTTTVLNAGPNQNLQVDFTPTDTTNYNPASKTVQINVLKATPTITWNNPADITYGTALSAIQLNATVNVLGAFTYTPAAGTVLNAGASQQLKVDFVPTNTANYNNASKLVAINVLKATPTITWNNPADITYGTALGATQLNATASVPGAFVYTPPATTVLDVGNNQNLSVNFTPTDTTNYGNASKNVAINVLKATPTITWSNPADITYGTALGATQLNATASVPGTISFNPASGTILNAGSNQILFASFSPTDTTRYNNATKNVSINILKANQNITFGALSGKTFGDAPFNVNATTSSGLPVVFSIFSGQATISGNTVTITGVGTVVVRASVAPNSNYNDATPVDQSFMVAKADQTITFGALPSKTFGDAPFNLSATSSSGLPVSFSKVSGPVTLAGNTVTITGVGHVVLRAAQTGNGNFNAASNVDQAFDVVSANANIALSNLAFTYDGTPKFVTVTTTPNGLSVTVSYSLNNVPIASPTSAGSYSLTATINDPNYQGSTTGTLVINKATPIITWGNPSNITFGTALSATQFNATANVPGAFQYSLPMGTVLSVGNYPLSATFTPTDATNYNSASTSVQLTVDPIPLPTLSFSSPAYVVNEGNGNVAIVVNRGGDTSGTIAVSYATSDTAGLNPCSLNNGIASSRCDYATTVGTLRFAAGESSKTIFVPIVDDSFSESSESFTITLSNPSGATLGLSPTATVAISDNDPVNGTNPINSVAFFVRQQYIDFLGREPDPVGYQGWQDTLKNCAAGDTRCDRIEVSAGFFRSEEFQTRGYFIYRFYSASLGRIPHYSEFIPDLAKVSGFLDAQQLEENKVVFVNEFISRQEFQNKYGSLTTPTSYVDALLLTAGLPNHPSRGAWITGLTNQTMTKAQVLRALIESTEVFNKYFNEAFVVMQYFGYLRRDPDIHYLDWIQTMNQNGGDYRVMINGFLNSLEYPQRFGQ